MHSSKLHRLLHVLYEAGGERLFHLTRESEKLGTANQAAQGRRRRGSMSYLPSSGHASTTLSDTTFRELRQCKEKGEKNLLNCSNAKYKLPRSTSPQLLKGAKLLEG